MWEQLLEIVKREPLAWAIYFEPGQDSELPSMTLEHFPSDYCGNIEKGAGDWEVTGTLSEVVKAPPALLSLLRAIRLEKERSKL